MKNSTQSFPGSVSAHISSCDKLKLCDDISIISICESVTLAEAKPFYEILLPALGFAHEAGIAGWVTYEVSGGREVPVFFGMIEAPGHVANECRIAFWADSTAEVERLAVTAAQAGARNVEGPLYEEPGYYAVFFEDPSGNRLEICCREPRQSRPATDP